jgi:dihydrofolate synthase/folylpolyglutamate synthase
VSAEALRWLLSYSDPARGVGWNTASRGGLEWNLRRTRALLDLAGSPDRALKVVLVAGTKGKGSTAALLASLLAASGVKAGLSTKPHLQSFRERIRVDGAAIDEDTLAERSDALRPLVPALARLLPDGGAPTTFELTTVLALAHYAAEGCAVAVVEVGLGGKFDATNATDPHVSVITPISHDHTRELGSGLGRIAAEKAGIIRPGRRALIAPQPALAQAAIVAACARTGTPWTAVAPLTSAAAKRAGLALVGAHQRANAAVALAAAEALAEHGVAVRADATGLATLRWPGRFEVVAGPPVLVLDGAHNDGSAEALAAALRETFGRRKIRFVLGLMADKDARAVIKPLLPLASAVEATWPHSARALAPASLARLVRGVPVRTHDDVGTAIVAARRDASAREVICVTGSLALVGEAREFLGLPVAERLWA